MTKKILKHVLNSSIVGGMSKTVDQRKYIKDGLRIVNLIMNKCKTK